MKGQEFRFHGVWDGEQVVALVHDLDGFLKAKPEETGLVYNENGDLLRQVAKGDVTWETVD